MQNLHYINTSKSQNVHSLSSKFLNCFISYLDQKYFKNRSVCPGIYEDLGVDICESIIIPAHIMNAFK